MSMVVRPLHQELSRSLSASVAWRGMWVMSLVALLLVSCGQPRATSSSSVNATTSAEAVGDGRVTLEVSAHAQGSIRLLNVQVLVSAMLTNSTAEPIHVLINACDPLPPITIRLTPQGSQPGPWYREPGINCTLQPSRDYGPAIAPTTSTEYSHTFDFSQDTALSPGTYKLEARLSWHQGSITQYLSGMLTDQQVGIATGQTTLLLS